jgi:sensor histidine kinase YesM
METAIIFAAWTVFALITANEFYMVTALRGRIVPWPIALRGGMLSSFLWALATVAIFWLARRQPLEKGHLPSRIAVHIMGAVLLACARTAVMVELSQHIEWIGRREFNAAFWGSSSINALYYALLLGIAHAVLYYRRFRERELAAERLAAGLTEARLHALKMQLQPHFLFNTLNAISALVPPEANSARRMVARLGDLLRIALEHEDTQEVTLREELAFLEPYLEIEQARLEDRLNVTMAIAPDTLELRVPHLLLQPLVENAIRHGIAPRIEPGKVEITAACSPDRRFLQLEVRDDGPGVDPVHRPRMRSGVGLSNVQSRLEQLYGRDHQFALETHPEGGAVVKISLPLRKADAAANTNGMSQG